MNFEQLKEFRQAAYDYMGKAKNAVFELTDAVLLTRSVSSFVELSLSPVFLRQVCKHLSVRPVSVWDSEYGNASFINQTADIPADKILRLRPNLCLWREPPPYSGIGRPRKHGEKFKLSDATTWDSPKEALIFNDDTWGRMEIRHWSGLHFRNSHEVPMELLRITRTSSALHKKDSKPMWLVWIGETLPTLESVWRDYLRRFAVDHWNRFAKQRLHWTLPKLGTPEHCQRWSDLMPMITWQLWLAREIVSEKPLPWQKTSDPAHLTPGRVAQSFGGVLAVIGTPAVAPKPRGKSPGWTKGRKRCKRTRYPVVKKGFSKAKKRKSG